MRKIAVVTQIDDSKWMVVFDWIKNGKHGEIRYYKSFRAAKKAADKANKRFSK